MQATCNPGRRRHYLRPATLQTSALVLSESSNEESSNSDATWGWCLDSNDQGWAEQVARSCQEYCKNSSIFSQFFLMLYCTNNFTLLSFNFLTISDHQRKQETRILVSSTATITFTPPHYHRIPDQYLSHHPKRLLGTPPYPYQPVHSAFGHPLPESGPTKLPSGITQAHWQSLHPGETRGTRDDKEATSEVLLGSRPSGNPSRTKLSSPPLDEPSDEDSYPPRPRSERRLSRACCWLRPSKILTLLLGRWSPGCI